MRKVTCLLSLLMVFGFMPKAAHAEDGYCDIDGVVVNDKGDPQSDARIRLMKPEGEGKKMKMLAETTTNDHGKFEFKKVAVGTFVIDAHKESMHAMQHVDLADGNPDMTIKLHYGSNIEMGKADGYTSIDGIVRGEDKQPLKGATVRLLGQIKGTDKMKEIDSVTTTSKGFFEFYKVEDGTFTIEVRSGHLTAQREVTIKSGERMDRLEFTLH